MLLTMSRLQSNVNKSNNTIEWLSAMWSKWSNVKWCKECGGELLRAALSLFLFLDRSLTHSLLCCCCWLGLAGDVTHSVDVGFAFETVCGSVECIMQIPLPKSVSINSFERLWHFIRFQSIVQYRWFDSVRSVNSILSDRSKIVYGTNNYLVKLVCCVLCVCVCGVGGHCALTQNTSSRLVTSKYCT